MAANDKLVEASRHVSRFVRRIIEGPLSVKGLPSACKEVKQELKFSDSTAFEKPFLNLLRISPLFASALVSALTLTYTVAYIKGLSMKIFIC